MIIFIALLLLAFIATRTIADFRAIRQTQRIHQKLVEVGKQNSQQPITVYVELNQRAETLFPLLDMIYAQNQPHVQVIVDMKPSARKATRTKLLAYAVQNNVSGLHIINHVKGYTVETLQRHATGAIVIKLQEGDILSPGFFASLSVDFLNPNAHIVLPGKVSRLNETLSSALKEHFSGVLRMKEAFLPISEQKYLPLRHGVAYRLATLFEADTRMSVATAQSAFIVSASSLFSFSTFIRTSVLAFEARLSDKYILGSSLAAFALLLAAAFVIPAQEMILLLVTIAALYTVTYAVAVLQTKAYQLQEKMSLILLAPIGFVFAIILYVATLLKMAWGALKPYLRKIFSMALPLASSSTSLSK